ncbi:MAG: helix-turn-helix domain-containing protein [Coriobacteriia bacterium]
MPVGDKLAAERRKQGKSLADVSGATHIMRRLLESLEHGRFDEMPSAVYVRGYIQNYAKYLGMDPAPLLAEFQEDLGGKRPRDARLEDVPEASVVPMRDQLHHIPTRTWLMLVGGLVLIGLVLWAVGAVLGREASLPPIPPATTTETVEPTATAPGTTTDTVPGTSTAEPTTTGEAVPGAAFTLKVTVADGAASWLRVLVDGKKAYEGTLTGGTSKQWTVKTAAAVRVGKPGSVTVTRDGVPVSLKSVDGVAVATITASVE